MQTIVHALQQTTTSHSTTITSEILGLLQHIALHGEGLRIRFRQDFAALQKITEANPDRDELSPMFDPRYCDIGPGKGFWIEGLCPSGEIAHVQAVRFDDLGETPLRQHWMNNRELYGPPGVDVDLQASCFASAPASEMIRGRVCYHGELWIREDYRGLRLSSKLANLAMLLALVQFDPDYLYCLIPPKTVRTGLSIRNGYLHLHPHGIRWNIADQEESYDEYIVWMTGAELSALMERSKVVC